MAKKIHETFNGDQKKQIETILKILWAIKDDSFYFFEYGKDLLQRYFDEVNESNKHRKKVLSANKDSQRIDLLQEVRLEKLFIKTDLTDELSTE